MHRLAAGRLAALHWLALNNFALHGLALSRLTAVSSFSGVGQNQSSQRENQTESSHHKFLFKLSIHDW